MIDKEENTIPKYRDAFDFYRKLPPTPERFISDRVLVDMMLADRSLLYVGGAGSCAGCGEATALRMDGRDRLLCRSRQHRHRQLDRLLHGLCQHLPVQPVGGLVDELAFFENGPTDAMGVRLLDQMGWGDKRLWVVGGDGAMLDIGFSSLSRMLTSGMDIKVLVLDTQVYSNTGGQSSTGTFQGQGTKMSPLARRRWAKAKHARKSPTSP